MFQCYLFTLFIYAVSACLSFLVCCWFTEAQSWLYFFFCGILIAHWASLFCMIFHPTKTGIRGEKEKKKNPLQCLDMIWYPALVVFKITNIIKLLWFPCQDSLSYLHRDHFQSFLSSNYSLLSFIPHQLLEKIYRALELLKFSICTPAGSVLCLPFGVGRIKWVHQGFLLLRTAARCGSYLAEYIHFENLKGFR